MAIGEILAQVLQRERDEARAERDRLIAENERLREQKRMLNETWDRTEARLEAEKEAAEARVEQLGRERREFIKWLWEQRRNHPVVGQEGFGADWAFDAAIAYAEKQDQDNAGLGRFVRAAASHAEQQGEHKEDPAKLIRELSAACNRHTDEIVELLEALEAWVAWIDRKFPRYPLGVGESLRPIVDEARATLARIKRPASVKDAER